MRPNKARRAVAFFFWIVLGLSLCILLGRLIHLDLDAFLSSFQQFSFYSLATGLVLVLAQIAFQISRLWVLFPRDVKMPWFHAAQTFVSGQFVSNFIQGQAGHAVKIAIACKNSFSQGRKLPLAESAAIVLVDKSIDVSTLMILTTLAVLQLSGSNWPAWPADLNLNLISGLLLAGIGIALGMGVICRFSTRIQRAFVDFRQGLKVIRDPGQLGRGFGMALGDWFTEGCLLQTLCATQGFPLSPAQLVVCLFLLNVGISAPISVANLGTFEAALTLALTQMGLPLVTSIAIATLFHLFQMLGILLWMLANNISRGNRTQSINSK